MRLNTWREDVWQLEGWQLEGPWKEEWGARGSMKQVTCFSESSQRSWVLRTSHNMAEGESSLLIWKLKVKAVFQSWSTFEYPRYLTCSTYYMHIYARGYTDKPQNVCSGLQWFSLNNNSVGECIFFLPFVGLFFLFFFFLYLVSKKKHTIKLRRKQQKENLSLK